MILLEVVFKALIPIANDKDKIEVYSDFINKFLILIYTI